MGRGGRSGPNDVYGRCARWRIDGPELITRCSATLRRHCEDGAVVGGSEEFAGAVESSIVPFDDGFVGKLPAVRPIVEDRLGPLAAGFCEFKNRATAEIARGRSAILGSSIEVAVRVERHGSGRGCAVFSASKFVDDLIGPSFASFFWRSQRKSCA